MPTERVLLDNEADELEQTASGAESPATEDAPSGSTPGSGEESVPSSASADATSAASASGKTTSTPPAEDPKEKLIASLQEEIKNIKQTFGRWGQEIGEVRKEKEQRAIQAHLEKINAEFRKALGEDPMTALTQDPVGFLSAYADSVQARLLQSPEVAAYGARLTQMEEALAEIRQQVMEPQHLRDFSEVAPVLFPNLATDTRFIPFAFKKLKEFVEQAKREGKADQLEAMMEDFTAAVVKDWTAKNPPPARTPDARQAPGKPERRVPPSTEEEAIRDYQKRMGPPT